MKKKLIFLATFVIAISSVLLHSQNTQTHASWFGWCVNKNTGQYGIYSEDLCESNSNTNTDKSDKDETPSTPPQTDNEIEKKEESSPGPEEADSMTTSGFNGLSEEQLSIYRLGIRYFDIDVANSDCWAPTDSEPSADRGEFIDKYGQYAIQMQRELGLPYEAVIAQAIYEGGVPESSLALEHYNFFGMKYAASTAERIGASGSVEKEGSSYMSFSSPQAGWTGYGKFITTISRYSAVHDRAFAIDPIGYIKELLAAGYTAGQEDAKTNPNNTYVKTMKSIVSQVHTHISNNHSDWPTMKDIEDEVGNSEATSSDDACDSAGDLMSDNFIVYSQCDPEWEKNAFGSSTICRSGCGPSALAMAITALGGKKVTPANTVEIANKYDVYISGAGSSHGGLGSLSNKSAATSAWGEFPSQKVSSVTIESFNEYFAKGYAIFGSGSGASPYTGGGHYILIRGVTTDGKWKIGDSAHSDTSDKEWDPADLIGPMADNSSSVYAIKKGD